MDQNAFSQRLAQLRTNKGVSARDMSVSIGQSHGYINNIEQGIGFPSMTVFFYICEYLGVTPSEFFNLEARDPIQEKALLKATRKLSREQLERLTAIAEDMAK